ncbi:leucine-rich repeat domain-containing protein [Sutcliffiella cohnii]|uniref:leucine-rich repeat domain-containing protein n=1 Tax=Sutcliffiella cohnii TaxID=33932 RepID=UPI002E209130|nr:LPXTG cell wall anchor domain-containing protein [Sutcliffiella cohnii]
MRKGFSILVILTLLISLLSPISTFAEEPVQPEEEIQLKEETVNTDEPFNTEASEESTSEEEIVEEAVEDVVTEEEEITEEVDLSEATEEEIPEEAEENEVVEQPVDEEKQAIREEINLDDEIEFIEGDFLYVDTVYVNENSFRIYWGAYSESERVSSYKIYLNDSLVLSPNHRTTEYTFTNLQPDTEYYVKVEAYNSSGKLIVENSLTAKTWKMPTGNKVTFTDAKLKQAIQQQIGVTRDIYESDMEQLTYLDASNMGISNLSGIEKATNLKVLYIFGNKIRNISYLSELTNLVDLDLDMNNISDVTPLRGLTNLVTLWLANNPVADISSLDTLVNLEYLFLHETNVSSIQVIENFTHLTHLTIEGTNVDYSEGTSTYELLMTLFDAGVYIDVFDEYYYENFEIWLEGVNENSAYFYWWHFDEEDPNYTYKVYLNGEFITETTEFEIELTNLNPDTEYELEVHVYDQNGEVVDVGYYLFSTLPLPTGEIVVIEDEMLEQAIKASLYIKNRPIYESDMERLEWLDAGFLGITSLEGLQKATNLEMLYVEGNEITDLTPLKNLPLIFLSVGSNNVSDLTALENLPLIFLDVSNNPITNINVLSTLIDLYYLLLHDTNISDISVLLELEYLEMVTLFNIPSLTFEEGSEELRIVQLLEERGVIVFLTEEDFYGSSDLYFHLLDVTSSEIELEWFYAGEYEVDHYEVYLDGELVDIVNEEYFYFSELLSETVYTVGIAAYDEYGDFIDYNEMEIETLAEVEGQPIDEEEEEKEEKENDKVETGKGDGASKNEGEKEEKISNTGNKLPKTATNMMNFLVVGFVLLTIGGITLLFNRRRRIV